METDNLLTGSVNRAYGSGSDSESGGGPSNRQPSHSVAEESNLFEGGTGEWRYIMTHMSRGSNNETNALGQMAPYVDMFEMNHCYTLKSYDQTNKQADKPHALKT